MKLKKMNVSKTTKKNIQQEILESKFKVLVTWENGAEFEQSYVRKGCPNFMYMYYSVPSSNNNIIIKCALQH